MSKSGKKVSKKKVLKIVLISLAVFIVLNLLGAAIGTSTSITHPKRASYDEVINEMQEAGVWGNFSSYDKEDYIVKGLDGYELHCTKVSTKDTVGTGKYVIISHGYTDNRMGSLKYAKMYLELGYNCIIYDLRGHGENKADFTTYGIREGMDLKCIIDDTRARYGDISVLGLHGESLGAATTVSALAYKPDVDFAVADCGFSDIENVLREGFKNAHVPQFLFDVADFAGTLRYRYSLKSMRPAEALDGNKVPVLFIHGEDDGFILPKNSQDMADRTEGYCEVHFIPGAGHAESILVAPEQYREIVSEFLKKTSVIP